MPDQLMKVCFRDTTRVNESNLSKTGWKGSTSRSLFLLVNDVLDEISTYVVHSIGPVRPFSNGEFYPILADELHDYRRQNPLDESPMIVWATTRYEKHKHVGLAYRVVLSESIPTLSLHSEMPLTVASDDWSDILKVKDVFFSDVCVVRNAYSPYLGLSVGNVIVGSLMFEQMKLDDRPNPGENYRAKYARTTFHDVNHGFDISCLFDSYQKYMQYCQNLLKLKLKKKSAHNDLLRKTISEYEWDPSVLTIRKMKEEEGTIDGMFSAACRGMTLSVYEMLKKMRIEYNLMRREISVSGGRQNKERIHAFLESFSL